MVSKQTVIHWFRKGLRIHDNPALLEAVAAAKANKSYLRTIFILDPLIIQFMHVGPNRWRFLQQSLEDLNKNLQSIGSKLCVVRGKPTEVFPKLFKTWNVSMMTFELDIEPYARERDKEVERIAESFNVKIIQKVSHTIFDTDLVVQKNLGVPPLTYQKFLSVVESFGKVPEAAKPPETIPGYCSPSQDEEELSNGNCYDPPTLVELGVNENDLSACKYPGGETEALKRLENCLRNKQWVCTFEKPNTSPNSIEPSTTVLSPYVKFGCLSSRLFYCRLKQVIGNTKHSKPPVSLIGQLMWREFYYTVAAATPNFDKMFDNKICYQIPWAKNDEYLEAWKFGRTGYPFIDAIMRQLRTEGWIHHLGRHAVACFLTRGDLWVSWEEGLKVFEEYLLDADWALNAGNWLWLSASAFFHQYFRVYSPVAFGKKTDKTGEYIRKYVPELKKYPSEYIYEPWNASLLVQKEAECVIGKDYPKRIIIHEDVFKKNIQKMAIAYKENKLRRESEDEVSTKDPGTSKIKAKRRSTGQGSLDNFVKKKGKK